MKISKEKINSLFEKYGYYMEDYILSKTYLSLYYLLNHQSIGQEVFSLCLDGPSGCGKSSFVKAYTSVASELLGEDVQFINFQLDAETGKNDLYEDVDVVATFENDTSKIRIPGSILKAIQLVNSGKYVILKMDEYDKARDSTDTFFNNFLQEGIVNTIQHGDVRIKPENMGKLQVFLCKNDMRVDLSEPMMRRNRIIRLDYMNPERMFVILQKFTNDNRLDEGLLNLVILIYQEIYKNKNLYTKLPSCSECQQAIMDSYLLLQVGGFSKRDIYNNIIENMLKIEDDVKSFESAVEKGNNENLKNLLKEMRDDNIVSQSIDINGIIARTIFANESGKLNEKVREIQDLITEYKDKFREMEKRKQKEINHELERINLANGSLELRKKPVVVRNFGDETAFVKRGFDIFDIADGDWTDVAEIRFPSLSHTYLINKLLENASVLGIKIYENGILIREDQDIKLIVVEDIDKNNNYRYRVMASQPVIPSTYLKDISEFIKVMDLAYKDQPHTTNQVNDDVISESSYFYSLNTLLYNDKKLYLENNGNNIGVDETSENVYGIAVDGDANHDVLSSIVNISCQDVSKSTEASKKIMSSKKKVLENE